MQITQNVSLANYSTMRLGGIADYLTEVRSRDDLLEARDWARAHQQTMLMIGGGSNIVWQDAGYRGLVIINRIPGYEDTVQVDGSHLVHIGAGENWDSVVARSVAAGLSGIEALSLIPGTVGATPVQNVGAYGQDISQTLQTVEVFDIETGTFTTIPAADCAFGYRTSRFKTDFRGKYFITALTLRLTTANPIPPFYASVQQYLETQPETKVITSAVLREAVIAIRSAKLPDMSIVANNGSFFANPIVSAAQLQTLLAANPDMPHWQLDDGTTKIPAAWLIEQAGFKDYHDEATGMATWPTQPLVLVNEHARMTADLIAFKTKLIDAVEAQFGITLIQEPELLP